MVCFLEREDTRARTAAACPWPAGRVNDSAAAGDGEPEAVAEAETEGQQEDGHGAASAMVTRKRPAMTAEAGGRSRVPRKRFAPGSSSEVTPGDSSEVDGRQREPAEVAGAFASGRERERTGEHTGRSGEPFCTEKRMRVQCC